MAISEKTVHDSLLLAADQINSSGGVLGKQLSVVSEDGASEPTTTRRSVPTMRGGEEPCLALRARARRRNH